MFNNGYEKINYSAIPTYTAHTVDGNYELLVHIWANLKVIDIFNDY